MVRINNADVKGVTQKIDIVTITVFANIVDFSIKKEHNV